MKIDDIALSCVFDNTINKWIVYSKKIPALLVQVTELDDAPKELGKLYESILKKGFKEKIHEITIIKS